jgi:hypothetical protein
MASQSGLGNPILREPAQQTVFFLWQAYSSESKYAVGIERVSSNPVKH